MLKICLFFITSISLLSFDSCGQKSTIVKQNSEVVPIKEYLKNKNPEVFEQAVFAGGCFWCVEAAFQQLEGIHESISGYSGGHLKYPSYKAVCSETTGHAEAVYLVYDPTLISYNDLLDVFFVAHDPTTLNRQGNDIGESYRSAIYYLNEDQKIQAENKIASLNESTFDNGIVTEVTVYEEFWVAEGYHQDYYWLNPNQSYVAAVSRPKVEKVAKVFKDRLRKEHK